MMLNSALEREKAVAGVSPLTSVAKYSHVGNESKPKYVVKSALTVTAVLCAVG